MNSKTTAPLLITLAPVLAAAPPLLLGGAIGLGVALVLKAILTSDKEKPPAATPAQPKAEIPRKPVETAVVRPTLAAIPIQNAPALSAPCVVVQPAVIRSVSTTSATVPSAVPAAKATLLPVARKLITRANLAAIFDNGKRALSRTAAVASLRRLGFGKSAAYAALSTNGRFALWLVCAPDGLLSWKDTAKG